jgi:serine protease Do
LDRSQKGALVSGVENGGWAAVAHLAVGDIVLAVDGEPVLRVDDLKARLQAVAAGKPPRVVFLVRRGVHTLYLEIEPAWK